MSSPLPLARSSVSLALASAHRNLFRGCRLTPAFEPLEAREVTPRIG